MEIFNIHEAKTHLSRLVENVARGKPFIIAKAGRPVAMVTAVDAPEVAAQRRLGFLRGEIEVPEDFDAMGGAEIARQFGIAEDDPPA